MLSFTLVVALQVLLRAIFSVSYTWHLNAPPKQCSDISITVTGSDGQPPYSVLVVPYGPPPFENKIDVRGVIDKQFDGNSKSIRLPINYPGGTQFVAAVSDASGFGTGGTSVATWVGQSNDNSCFNVSQPWRPHFWFFIGPLTQPAAEVVQCNTTRVWWNYTADVEGTPANAGVIPGGQSFSIIPESGIDNTTDEGIGFTWVPRVREGTPIVIVAGDSRGLGTGGSAQFTAAHSDNANCVSDVSPTTTPGTPAGSVKKELNIPAIVGGSVGGGLGLIALIALGIFLCFRRRRDRGETPMWRKSIASSVLSDRPDTSVGTGHASSPHVLSVYNPEPFRYPGPISSGFNNEYAHTGGEMTQPPPGLQLSYSGPTSNSGSGQVGIYDSSMTSTSSPPMQPRNISFVQHEDAGGGGVPTNEVPTTINLPPRYDSLQGNEERQGTPQGKLAPRRPSP